MEQKQIENGEVNQVFERVRRVIVKVVERPGLRSEGIRMESSLIEDIRITSLTFVELAVALEEDLQINEFPMQEWIDAEMRRTDSRFRIASLVEKCLELMGK